MTSLGYHIESEEPSGPVWLYWLQSGRVAWTPLPECAELFADGRRAIDLAFSLVECGLVYSCRVVSDLEAQETAREHTRRLTAHQAPQSASGPDATKAGPPAGAAEGVAALAGGWSERHTPSRGESTGALARSRAPGDLEFGEPPASHGRPRGSERLTGPSGPILCMECGVALTRRRSGPPAATCSDRCRKRLSRRLRSLRGAR